MKRKTSFTLTPQALALLRSIAVQLGISQAGVLELLIREKAKAEGLLKDQFSED